MRIIQFRVELECNTEFTQNEPKFIEVTVECDPTDNIDVVSEKINAAFEAQQFSQRVVGDVQAIIDAEIIPPA